MNEVVVDSDAIHGRSCVSAYLDADSVLMCDISINRNVPHSMSLSNAPTCHHQTSVILVCIIVMYPNRVNHPTIFRSHGEPLNVVVRDVVKHINIVLMFVPGLDVDSTGTITATFEDQYGNTFTWSGVHIS